MPLSTIITITSGLIAAASLYYAMVRAREARKTRLLPVFNSLRSEILSSYARESRRFIYENRLTSFEVLSPENKERVESVCTIFDFIGVLVRLDYVDCELLFSQFYDVIIKCWLQVHDLVKHERSPGRKYETYMKDFEYLYHRARKYARKRGLKISEVHPKDVEPTQQSAPQAV